MHPLFAGALVHSSVVRLLTVVDVSVGAVARNWRSAACVIGFIQPITYKGTTRSSRTALIAEALPPEAEGLGSPSQPTQGDVFSFRKFRSMTQQVMPSA